MINKELLIVYNTFGLAKDASQYINGLNSIFWHIEKHNLQNSVRVVVSSVLNEDKIIDELLNIFKNKIKIFRYDYRWPVQVSFNNTCISSEREFNENYNGYFYISAGVELNKIEDLFPRILDKNNSGEYGVIQLFVNDDNGNERLSEEPDFQAKIDISKDYLVPIKHFCNFHVAIINKSVRDFYGVLVTDIFGVCGMEIATSFVSYALRKKYIILGNSLCNHKWNTDSKIPQTNSKGELNPNVPCGLNWGRTHDIFLNDLEGIDAGLGYYPGPYIPGAPWKYFYIPPKLDKYDDNYLSLDERLKYAVKRCYFTNKNEVDYSKIKYLIV